MFHRMINTERDADYWICETCFEEMDFIKDFEGDFEIETSEDAYGVLQCDICGVYFDHEKSMYVDV